MGAEKVYGVADKAWHPVIGCDPTRPCAARCWARRTEARVVECQEGIAAKHPGTDKGKNATARAELVQLVLTPDRQQWSGKVVLDMAHLLDPLDWRRPAVIATGFHGDVGLLDLGDLLRIVSVASECPQHDFLFLTKSPSQLYEALRQWPEALPNVTIGCSVMYQDGEFGATKMRKWMLAISKLGWRTHVWYEPALGPVNWTGWEFIERLIYGGESGSGARANNVKWARDTLAWARRSSLPDRKIAFVMKQLGADAWIERERWHNDTAIRANDVKAGSLVQLVGGGRKGDDLESIPADLQVRELPEVPRGTAVAR
jgi:protein gp37